MSESMNDFKTIESSQTTSQSIPLSVDTIYTSLEKVLECSICLRTLCEPISIPCGHTFCRTCLVSSLRRSKKKCPECREVCHVEAETASENHIIKAIAQQFNPNSYATRLQEAEAEKVGWRSLLPIFYYNSPLFPGMKLSLHLFEPRYKLMMQRIVAGNRQFAYVPNFTNYQAAPGDVALIAQLEESEFLHGKSYDIHEELLKRPELLTAVCVDRWKVFTRREDAWTLYCSRYIW